MTLTEHALRGATIRAGAPNRLSVGLPWYRSLPCSAVLGIELEVDGVPVTDLRLRLDGEPVREPELAGRSWFLQDRHVLEWTDPVRPAGSADVVLRMRLQLPNLVGPAGAVQVLQEARARVPVEAAR